MVQKIVNKYPSHLREDLEQEACFALYKASLNWSEERGASFGTLAYVYIQNACKKYMRDKAELIRIPARKYESGERIVCDSLDQLVADGLTLESTVGETDDAKIDSFVLWNFFSSLMEANILKRSDVELLYYKYVFNYSCEALSSMLNCSRMTVSSKVSNLLQKMRPYFFGRKKI